MLKHYRSKHEGVKYPCNLCGKQFTQQSSLQTHIQSQHEGVKYPCNPCDYQATTQSSVELPSEEAIDENISEEATEEDFIEEKPIQAEESKVRPRRQRSQISNDNKSTQCPECGAQFTTKGSMMTHYRSKHEGVKYPCNQCDYQATQQSNLQTHIAAKHTDNILQCELCDYQTKWRYQYNKHKKAHTTV